MGTSFRSMNMVVVPLGYMNVCVITFDCPSSPFLVSYLYLPFSEFGRKYMKPALCVGFWFQEYQFGSISELSPFFVFLMPYLPGNVWKIPTFVVYSLRHQEYVFFTPRILKVHRKSWKFFFSFERPEVSAFEVFFKWSEYMLFKSYINYFSSMEWYPCGKPWTTPRTGASMTPRTRTGIRWVAPRRLTCSSKVFIDSSFLHFLLKEDRISIWESDSLRFLPFFFSIHVFPS